MKDFRKAADENAGVKKSVVAAVIRDDEQELTKIIRNQSHSASANVLTGGFLLLGGGKI